MDGFELGKIFFIEEKRRKKKMKGKRQGKKGEYSKLSFSPMIFSACSPKLFGCFLNNINTKNASNNPIFLSI